MKHNCFSLALVFLLLAFTAKAESLPKFGKVSDSEWALTSIPDYPDANAVVLFDIGVLEVTSDGITITKHVRIKVFNKVGAEEAGDVSIFYWEDDKIKNLKAHTITPDGVTHEVSDKDIKEQKAGDYKSRTFAFPQITPGSILEYSYYNYNTRFAYIDPWYFHNKFYTLKSQFALKLAVGFVYSTAFNNIPAMYQEGKQEDDPATKARTFTWKLEKLPPLTNEPYLGAEKNFKSALNCQLVSYEHNWTSVTFIKNWPDLGKSFTENYIEPYVRSGKGLDELAKRLSGTFSSTEDRAVSIYDYVRDSIRNMAGETRYFPHEKMEQMLIEKIGTTDEKNLLIVELCKRAGMKAWPALISTRDHGIFNPQIYQVRQFNQVLAVVETDKGGIVLDATSRYCPYGILSPNCLVKAGLIMDGDKSRPISINPMPAQSSRIDRTFIRMDDSGLVRCSTHTILNGYFTVDYGEKYETTDTVDFIRDVLFDDLEFDYVLINHQVTVSPGEQKMEAFVTYTSPKLSESVDGNLFIGQPVFNFSTNPFTAEKRFFPIDFTFPALYHNIVTYEIDSGYTAPELPEPKSLVASKLEYKRTSFEGNTTVVVESELLIKEALLSQESYMSVRNLFSEIERANREQVVFVPLK